MKFQLPIACMTIIVALFMDGCAGTSPPQAKAASDPGKAQITILYDAFGKGSEMQKDWGFAALVEYGGRRILFDTGDNADILARNSRAKGVDLSNLDFVVMSHRHGDHMAGLSYVLSVNPKVKVYAPKENFGVYGFSLPGSFYRKDAALPPEQRYYDGVAPETMKFGSAWQGANFDLIEKTTEIAPGIHLIALVSDKPTTLELRELSLAIDTPAGMVIVVGCSHPGIDKVVEAAAAINKNILLIAGGFHLVVAKDPDIDKITALLRDTYQVAYVAPGHCTGEPTFSALQKSFGNRYIYAGLGSVIALGPKPHHAGEASAYAWDDDERRVYRELLARSADEEYPMLAARDTGLPLPPYGSDPSFGSVQ